MMIETKYGTGETIWFLSTFGKIENAEIIGIDISLRSNKEKIVKYYYNIGNGTKEILEDKIRKTKQEVGDDWLKLNGLETKKKDK